MIWAWWEIAVLALAAIFVAWSAESVVRSRTNRATGYPSGKPEETRISIKLSSAVRLEKDRIYLISPLEGTFTPVEMLKLNERLYKEGVRTVMSKRALKLIDITDMKPGTKIEEDR